MAENMRSGRSTEPRAPQRATPQILQGWGLQLHWGDSVGQEQSTQRGCDGPLPPGPVGGQGGPPGATGDERGHVPERGWALPGSS